MTTAKEAMQALAIPHELDDMPPKVLRELSAAEFGAYITHLRNQARELQRARQERDDARVGCKGLSDKLAAFIESAGADSERYRWLREGCNDKLSEATRIAADCYGIEWDAAIDQARAAMLAARSTTPARGPHVTTAAELKQQAKSDMSCVGAFARARPPARTKE